MPSLIKGEVKELGLKAKDMEIHNHWLFSLGRLVGVPTEAYADAMDQQKPHSQQCMLIG